MLSCFASFSLNAANSEPLHFAHQKLQSTVDSYLASRGKIEHLTGIAVAVFLPEKVASLNGDIQNFYAGNQGLAPYDKPVTSKTLFEIGSITKSFIAAILLQMEGEGKLSIEDPIGKWLPQYPQWKAVKIKDLLSMTSGIPSYSTNDSFDKILENDLTRQWSDTQLLQYAQPDKSIPPRAETHFDYSNSNYILAGMIIEKVSGEKLALQLQKRLLTPLLLMNSYYPAGENGQALLEKLLPQMARGYTFDDKTQKLTDITKNNLSWAGAAGAIVSDINDVVHWVQALYNGKIFKDNYRQKALTELKTVVSIPGGKEIANIDADQKAGFGLGVAYLYDPQQENRFWAYEGSTLGYRVMYIWSECSNVTVAVALNSKAGEGDSASPQGDGIKDLCLALYKDITEIHPEYNCKNL